MKIKDLEMRTGLERATIRYYEKEGLLQPGRLENGYREYSEEDANQLQKIKLLRQLGMSVEKIKNLQQGTADFSREMDEQIKLLTQQMNQNKRAREVCKVMQSDGVNYSSMDPAHYLRLLQEPGEISEPSSGFQERIPEPIHPWRRFFARSLDYMLFSSIMQMILFLIFRIRPIPGEGGNVALSVVYTLLFIPLEALMVHFWGTTPGKMAMGIRLEHFFQGGRLSLGSAFHRAARVCMLGTGFGIPVVEIITNVLCYCKLTGRATHPSDMTWDDETELIYEPRSRKSIAVLAAMIMAFGLITCVTVNDLIKPYHRGDSLTIAQFAENYNQTLRWTYSEPEIYNKLMPDGVKYPVPDGVGVIYIGGDRVQKRDIFAYETEGAFLSSITYQNRWEDIFFLRPVNLECYNAAVSLLMAQEGCGSSELNEFTEIWESHLQDATVSFRYQNLEVQWEQIFENCFVTSGGFLIEDNEQETSSAEVVVRLILHKK